MAVTLKTLLERPAVTGASDDCAAVLLAQIDDTGLDDGGHWPAGPLGSVG